MGMPTSSGPRELSAPRLVFKNTAWLVVGQLLSAPIAVLVNAVFGRKLGPADLGYVYLASTLCLFGFLLVDFGQSTVLPALIAQERNRAGEFLGTALAWRAGAAALVGAVLLAGSLAFGHDQRQQLTIALVALAFGIGTLGGACQDAIRGFERTDLAAVGQVGQQLLGAALVVPVLLLGGGLAAALCAQVVAAALGLCGASFFAYAVGFAKVAPGRAALRQLLAAGSPFLLLGSALALQPSVDALLLARLAPPEVVGWHAVARRLSGVLLMPVAALISSLYPTLSRLYREDRAEYFRLARTALRGTAALAVPIALSCALYPEVGTRIFGHDSFGPADDNLRVLSGFVFLVYFSMTLGCCLSAAGRQRGWALCQLGCVAVSAALDPLLIPYFQSRRHNGGIGVCLAAVVSEVAMALAAALWLSPRGLLDRRLGRELLAALTAGCAMAVVARLLASTSPFLSASLSISTYVGVLWVLGGIEQEQLLALRGAIARRWKA